MALTVRLKKTVPNFSLDVAWEVGNEIAVLFGFSGSGKSMTLQLLAGLLKPDDGMISLNGTRYFDSAEGIDLPPQRRTFGYVFQDLALFPHMTVLKNVLFAAREVPKPERLDRARKIIAAFQLTGLESRYPSEISGGRSSGLPSHEP